MRAIEYVNRLIEKLASGDLDPNEPLFVLRARDKSAADHVRRWAEQARNMCCPLEKVDGAVRCAEEMDRWPTKRVPGCPDTECMPDQQATSHGAAGSFVGSNRACTDIEWANDMLAYVGRPGIPLPESQRLLTRIVEVLVKRELKRSAEPVPEVATHELGHNSGPHVGGMMKPTVVKPRAEYMPQGAEDEISAYRAALEAIAGIGGNLPDDRLESATGPNDARLRGGMVISARAIAREALGMCGTDAATV